MRGRLGRIDDEEKAMLPGGLCRWLQVLQRSRYIPRGIHDDALRLRTDHILKRGAIIEAVAVRWDPRYPHSHLRERPHHRIVLIGGHDDMIPRVEESLDDPVHRFRYIPREGNAFRMGEVIKPSKHGTEREERIEALLHQTALRSVEIEAACADILCYRLRGSGGFRKSCRCIVEIYTVHGRIVSHHHCILNHIMVASKAWTSERKENSG